MILDWRIRDEDEPGALNDDAVQALCLTAEKDLPGHGASVDALRDFFEDSANAVFVC